MVEVYDTTPWRGILVIFIICIAIMIVNLLWWHFPLVRL